MKRIQVVGLCLVAVFALSALTAASASAAFPEYKDCKKLSKNLEKKYTGEYSSKKCSPTEESATDEGKYEREEWNSGKTPVPALKGKLTGGAPHNNIIDPICPEGKFNQSTHKCEAEGEATATEKAQVGGTTTCTKEKFEGKLTGPKTDTWKSTYSKCEALETPCNTKAAAPGTIITDELEGTLVFLQAGKEAGVRVKGLGPAEHAGPTGVKTKRLAQYECLGGALNVEVFGEILAKNKGNAEEAAKSIEASAVEGPLAMQADLYEGGAHGSGTQAGEEFGKATYLWGFHFSACVTEGVTEDGESVGAAEFKCFSEEVGPYPGYPEPGPQFPVTLESVTSLGAGPATQNGATAIKGDKEILVAEAPTP